MPDKSGLRLNQDYEQITKKFYQVDILPENFESDKALYNINQYMAKATNNRVQNFFLDSDLVDVEVLMATAFFFKGQWMSPFNASKTTKEKFYDERSNEIGTVKMMYQTGAFPYTIVPYLSALAVELPYGRVSFINFSLKIARFDFINFYRVTKCP